MVKMNIPSSNVWGFISLSKKLTKQKHLHYNWAVNLHIRMIYEGSRDKTDVVIQPYQHNNKLYS